MNDAAEIFERELAGLRPQQPSADLRKKIELELSHTELSRPSAAAVWSIAITVGALAASLLLIVLPMERDVGGESGPTIVPVSVNTSLPTVWAYRQAITSPSQSLDRLLDQYGHHSATDDSLSHVNAFLPFPSQNQNLWGDL